MVGEQLRKIQIPMVAFPRFQRSGRFERKGLGVLPEGLAFDFGIEFKEFAGQFLRLGRIRGYLTLVRHGCCEPDEDYVIRGHDSAGDLADHLRHIEWI